MTFPRDNFTERQFIIYKEWKW